MSRLAFTPTAVSLRQVLAQGRFYEAITNREIAGFAASLSYSHADGEGIFDTRLAIKPAGYFALSLDPSSTMPNFSAYDSITLTLTLTKQPSTASITAQKDVASAQLALVEQEYSVNKQTLKLLRVSGAPFVFDDIAVEPEPFLLDGLLLRDNDPEDPVGGVAVTVVGFDEIQVKNTDSEGRFRIATLPISETVTLQFTDADNTIVTKQTLRPAWGHGSMSKTFSLPSS